MRTYPLVVARACFIAGLLRVLAFDPSESLGAGRRSDSAGVTVDAAFASLKGLAGVWRGKTGTGQPVTIEYKTAANGSTLIETQSPAAADEMVTVYSVSGTNVVLTHYCPMGKHGNQPRMVLDRSASTAADLRFIFTGGSNLDSDEDMHVHNGRIVLLDANHIQREWEVYNHGQRVVTERFLLSREDGKSADRR